MPQVIKTMMHQHKDTVNREKGNGLKIPKFHQMLHILFYILRFGCLNGTNSERPEANARTLAKLPADLTSRNFSTFEPQIGVRLSEFITLDAGLHELIGHTFGKVPPADDIPEGGTKFTIVLGEEDADGDPQIKVVEKKQKKSAKEQMHLLPVDIVTFLRDTLLDWVEGDKIECFTEHKRNGTIFRAHPGY